MEIAKLNGIELEYEVKGSGEPVLLIEPLLTGAFMPFLSAPVLADGYRLIRYHKRGWGRSTHTPPPLHIADYAAEAAQLLDFLGVSRSHVVGHSSGGSIAAQLAIDRPDLVHSIVLLEPALLAFPSAQLLLEKAAPSLEAFASGDHKSAIAGFLSAVSGLDWNVCRAAIESRAPGAIDRTIEDADTFFMVELPAVQEWRLPPERATQVSQPVLSVRGSETEPVFVDASDYLRDRLPSVKECTIEGAGHLLQLQRPDPVAASIADFFNRHSLEASQAERLQQG